MMDARSEKVPTTSVRRADLLVELLPRAVGAGNSVSQPALACLPCRSSTSAIDETPVWLYLLIEGFTPTDKLGDPTSQGDEQPRGPKQHVDARCNGRDVRVRDERCRPLPPS